AALEAAAARAPAGAGGACFLPHLRGRTTPRPNPAARGAFQGLSVETGFDDLARAVLEGIAFTAAQLAEVMCAIPGVPAAEEIRMISGGTRNALLTRIKASVYNRPLSVAPMEDGTARGAAVLAALAAGVFPGVAQAQAALGEDFATVEPDPDWVPVYAELAARYAADSLRD
ncbi:MAG: hypothetical protein MI785_06130, partial [Kiloniellales bacterium]|nr:hypothetical protein [Kiloniellales bacterium]